MHSRRTAFNTFCKTTTAFNTFCKKQQRVLQPVMGDADGGDTDGGGPATGTSPVAAWLHLDGLLFSVQRTTTYLFGEHGHSHR